MILNLNIEDFSLLSKFHYYVIIQLIFQIFRKNSTISFQTSLIIRYMILKISSTLHSCIQIPTNYSKIIVLNSVFRLKTKGCFNESTRNVQ